MFNHLPESFLLASILAEQGMHHQEGLWIRMIGQRQLETNPITIKPQTASHAAELFSWTPLPDCTLPGCPFPIKSLALSACVSSDNSFLGVRQEPSFGSWKRSPFLQQDRHNFCVILPSGHTSWSRSRSLMQAMATMVFHYLTKIDCSRMGIIGLSVLSHLDFVPQVIVGSGLVHDQPSGLRVWGTNHDIYCNFGKQCTALDMGLGFPHLQKALGWGINSG